MKTTIMIDLINRMASRSDVMKHMEVLKEILVYLGKAVESRIRQDFPSLDDQVNFAEETQKRADEQAERLGGGSDLGQALCLMNSLACVAGYLQVVVCRSKGEEENRDLVKDLIENLRTELQRRRDAEQKKTREDLQ